jgi:hypothetical protein
MERQLSMTRWLLILMIESHLSLAGCGGQVDAVSIVVQETGILAFLVAVGSAEG